MSHAWWTSSVRLIADLRQGARRVGQDTAHVAPFRDPATARHHVVHRGHERRQQQGGDDERRPQTRPPDGMQPARHEQQEDRGRRQRPPQVVEHLPTPDQRQARAGSTEYPGEELPVATRPAMLANGGDQVARRELLEQRDVGDQPGAREQAFEEIVAQQRVLGYPAGERPLERIDVVDALAGVGPFGEEVLVDVRHGGGVRIDAAGPGERPLIEGRVTRPRARSA